jgi:hypothetical protein
MDLWDVIKVMGRRWAVALPLLLATVSGTAWTASTVAPEYTATTKVGLLSPTEGRADPSNPVNPWDAQGLTLAALSKINSKALHEQFEARGLPETWLADLDARSSSLILIEVTADSPETATATAQALQREVRLEVDARQSLDRRLTPESKYTTVAFDEGDDIETTTTKLKRTLVVVAGIGFIITIGVTIGVDAMIRRRGRRRDDDFPEQPLATGLRHPTQQTSRFEHKPGAAAPGADARLAAPRVAAPHVAAPRVALGVAAPGAAAPGGAAPGGGAENTVVRTHVVPARSSANQDAPVTEMLRLEEPAEPPTSPGFQREKEDTATIVLPLTNPGRLPGRDSRGPGGSGVDGRR